ncbi:ABC transporter ATP-binding protein [Neisseria gonorrhoeae]|nr:ABC transporter ATP-binding protein [Neisseria gonorrhoeae]
MISRVNKALRSTSIMVTHDIEKSLEIVDQVIFLAHGEIMFSGSPQEMRELDSPWVRQFVGGLADGPWHTAIRRKRRCSRICSGK